ncbi:MAG: helix-turn-helix domain-containing protein, partial [Erysipelotrichaceae bacterium]|nr:helix-turn-helix domain-containing protein [Erysipelotrichaceae bacterium]
MKCCLPNKLIILRKHFNYSQQEIAKKLNVSINEYMAFENGNAMCSMEQIKQLADIFHISVDEMFVNSVDIELPVIEPTLDIPFVTKEEEIEQASEDLGMTKRFDT